MQKSRSRVRWLRMSGNKHADKLETSAVRPTCSPSTLATFHRDLCHNCVTFTFDLLTSFLSTARCPRCRALRLCHLWCYSSNGFSITARTHTQNHICNWSPYLGYCSFITGVCNRRTDGHERSQRKRREDMRMRWHGIEIRWAMLQLQ